jgi:hypothetical protein
LRDSFATNVHEASGEARMPGIRHELLKRVLAKMNEARGITIQNAPTHQ